MLAKLEIELSNKENFGFEISSLLQGFLMESIPTEYAAKLHEQGLKPYSQYVEKKESSLIWHINTFTEEAKDNIVDRMMHVDSVELRYKECTLKVVSKKIEMLSYEELLAGTYFEKCPRKIRIEFMSPTAFKVDGKYQFYPTAEHILKSLVSKHDSIDGKTEVYSEDFINQIVENVSISGYRLRSVKFPLEGVNVPAFLGNVTLTVGGPQQFVNLINMLCMFGEFSGTGIKTGIGMGGIKVQQMHRKEKGIGQ